MIRLPLMFGLMISVLVTGTPRAETVNMTLPSTLVAQAEYREGRPDKPAVLLLHGFLQTRDAPTIHRLTEALADEGYTVLAPTLTLDVTYRSQSLACEATHRHTVGAAVQELDAWVKWLKANDHKSIIMASHSFGSVETLAYLSSYPDRAVRKFIGVSIVEGELKGGESTRAGLIRQIRIKLRAGKHGLEMHPFSFCHNFLSTPESILSYLEWSPDRILAAINKTRVPITFIMGSKDDRLGAGWIEKLKSTKAKVIIIEGANHFMDGQYEFDLTDQFLSEINNHRP